MVAEQGEEEEETGSERGGGEVGWCREARLAY